MIDTSKWEYFYKIDYTGGHEVTTNMMYTPKVNSEKTMMCMIWDENEPYQNENTKMTKELIDFFFEREIRYLTYFQKFDWAAKLIEIDNIKRSIFIEFPGETLNNIVTNPNRSLDIECPDWKDQIFNILKDIKECGYYKMALYPHCFFINNNKITTFDFYGCIEMSYPYIERNKIEGLIGPDSSSRFDSATTKDVVDFSVFFKNTMISHLHNTWSQNPFPEFYRKLFDEKL